MNSLHPAWMDWPETQALDRAFAARSAELRFVGGCVRDALLGRPVSDVDAATPLLPEAVIALLEAAGIPAVPTGIDHGTVTAVINKKHFEITTLRKDVATDGRHATVAYTDDWKEDAARRDFTMNALYLSPLGQLFDYFGGEEDARAGRVHFIGEALARIREDYLRILRFFRFHAWYGRGLPDEGALAACAAAAPQISQLSGERLRHEMLKLLAASAPYHSLALMQEKNILAYALGFNVKDCQPVSRLEQIEVMTNSLSDALARLALLLLNSAKGHDVALARLIQTWKLPNEPAGQLQIILDRWDDMQRPKLAQQKKLMRRIGPPAFKRLVLVRWAMESDTEATRTIYEPMLALALQWQPPLFMVAGRDLQALGIPEGRKMGEILRALEEEWEKSDYSLSKDELLAKARR